MIDDISKMPKTGHYYEVEICNGSQPNKYVSWDNVWAGGKGGWFTPQGHAIAQKNITGWRHVSPGIQEELKALASRSVLA